MCLAIPGKIISIDDSSPELKMAKVNFGGIIKDTCIQLINDVSIGDYIIVHAGFALNKVDTTEAEETIRMLSEMSKLLEDEDLERN